MLMDTQLRAMTTKEHKLTYHSTSSTHTDILKLELVVHHSVTQTLNYIKCTIQHTNICSFHVGTFIHTKSIYFPFTRASFFLWWISEMMLYKKVLFSKLCKLLCCGCECVIVFCIGKFCISSHILYVSFSARKLIVDKVATCMYSKLSTTSW